MGHAQNLTHLRQNYSPLPVKLLILSLSTFLSSLLHGFQTDTTYEQHEKMDRKHWTEVKCMPEKITTEKNVKSQNAIGYVWACVHGYTQIVLMYSGNTVQEAVTMLKHKTDAQDDGLELKYQAFNKPNNNLVLFSTC